MSRIFVILLVCLGMGLAHGASDASKPKVRAITAFVRLDRSAYARQIDDALSLLNATKSEFARRGYETQTLRIVTQPLPELVQGCPISKHSRSCGRSMSCRKQRVSCPISVRPCFMTPTTLM